jgi:hypothetical protein
MKECQPSQVLFDYLQQELRPDQLDRIEAHLPHCAACREELARLRQQIQKVRATLARLDPAPSLQPKPELGIGQPQARPIAFIPSTRLATVLTTAIVLILCGVSLLDGTQSILANSISQLKVIVDVSAVLKRTTSMDCYVLMPGSRSEKSYRVRWSASSITRVDRESTGGVRQTLWISNTTVPPDPVWQPSMEFLTPAILARHLEGSYGLMQTGQWKDAGSNEFQLVGREDQHVIEIAIDGRTYLPKTLRKYLPDSGTGEARKCVLEARFLWNRPVPEELMIPRLVARKR